ncbi:hypothetical protein [Reichenbachiella ulvae]|uniref:Uncharacterized protein n=1 Tax=Reichenbachiella ulvae TaxID=2980104 RepID=A0ABT3CTE3_9BACT|nr:hypothetical protein [Reichenbachiella ulvae]MCV9386745.1 hypothetical protein [Reichenbachiella ulvae]
MSDLQEEKAKLEIEKLKVELELLEAQKPEKEPQAPKRSIAVWAQNSSKVILTLVSVIGGIWGLVIPINELVQQRQQEMEFRLDGVVLKAMGQLSTGDESEKNQAILTLNYYGKDAIPILLFSLEEEGRKGGDPEFVEILIQTIADIYYNLEESKLRERVLNRILKGFLQVSSIELSKEDADDANIDAVTYYLLLIETLKLVDADEKLKVSEALEDFIHVCDETEDYAFISQRAANITK